MILEDIYQGSIGVGPEYEHAAVLFIGSESYDAPTITIMEGLQELDFTVYTIGKPNINSWFVNQVIDDPQKVRFDFIISNLHWGTRFSLYSKFGLHDKIKVLIDGDDHVKPWGAKYQYWRSKYQGCPPEEVMRREMQPYRWMDDLSNYEPDVVFVSQKEYGSKDYYLPFGIQREYMQFAKRAPTRQRGIDFAHVMGTGGGRRGETAQFIRSHALPGRVYNDRIYGGEVIPNSLRDKVRLDNNIHSYHRWVHHSRYFSLLNNTKVLIYPGVTKQWDSKRPWEGYASGCLVLLQEPNIDVSQYPVTELCPYAVYDSHNGLLNKCNELHWNTGHLDKLRIETVEMAHRYFTPGPLARYFLRRIKDNTG